MTTSLVLLCIAKLWVLLVVSSLLAAATTNQANNNQLKTVLCSDKCHSLNCQSYTTPLQTCFSATALFPGDDSWSEYDLLDDLVGTPTTTTTSHEKFARHSQLHQQKQLLLRSIYASTNGTCQGSPTDRFRLPLNQCVGPFGTPRPWGNFSVVNNSLVIDGDATFVG